VVTTDVNVGEIEDLELKLGMPGVVEGRIVYETTVPPTGRATRIAMKQRLLPVSPLYPVSEGRVESDGRFRIEHALGEYEFEIAGLPAGLRVTRVLQHGRSIANGRIRVTSGETLTDLELVVGN
jgi:hypothetical protein